MVKNKIKKCDDLKELDLIYEIMNSDEVLDRQVTAFGNSAHIPVPLKHLGKKTKVIIFKKEGGNKEK